MQIDGFGIPLQCLGLQSFTNKLIFSMVSPVVVSGILLLGFIIRAVVSARRQDLQRLGTQEEGTKFEKLKRASQACKDGGLSALPVILFLSVRG